MKQKRRTKLDPMLAMINVVFLLLAFFLMGHFEPSPPASIQLPIALNFDEVVAAKRAYIDADGLFYFEDHTGDMAIELAGLSKGQLMLSVDAELPANALPKILSELSFGGLNDFTLEVAQ